MRWISKKNVESQSLYGLTFLHLVSYNQKLVYLFGMKYALLALIGTK
ncbi:hypothetical protein SDC9_129886 [bioreactor metagenome]|uniref:Uncharacterized protein n=1 Tax=bioreactor metagenome TaxID=1076179 RepID=A0A645D0S3_9ZZZZ